MQPPTLGITVQAFSEKIIAVIEPKPTIYIRVGAGNILSPFTIHTTPYASFSESQSPFPRVGFTHFSRQFIWALITPPNNMGTMAEMQFDSKACFDRIMREETNTHTYRLNVDKALLEARSMIKDRLERRVQTAHGVSDKIYKHSPSEP